MFWLGVWCEGLYTWKNRNIPIHAKNYKMAILLLRLVLLNKYVGSPTISIQPPFTRTWASIKRRQELVAQFKGIIHCHSYKEKESTSNMVSIYDVLLYKILKKLWFRYFLLQGNEVMPLITSSEEQAKAGIKGKVRSVKIQVDDADLVNFITGG